MSRETVRVFVGYGYEEQEKWIRTTVLPFLSQLGLKVVGGENVDRPINEAIRWRIGSCDVMIGILTRRGRARAGRYASSAYVRQEIEIALGREPRIPVVQVAEQGTDEVGGTAQELQRIYFQRDDLADLLVRLGEQVRQWVDGAVTIRIMPQTLAQALARQQGKKPFCTYHIYDQLHPTRSGQALIEGDGGGMFTKLLGFSPGTKARLEIEVDGKKWESLHTLHTEPFTQIHLARVPSR